MAWQKGQRRLDYLLRIASFSLAIAFLLPLGACTSSPPPPSGLCDWNGEAPPPVVGYEEPVTAPSVADGAVYIGYKILPDDGYSFQNIIAAFRASDGKLLWQRLDPIEAAGVVASKDVLIVSNATSLAALRTSDGALLWQLSRGSYAGMASQRSYGNDLIDGPQLVLNEGILYAIDGSGLYAVRVADGRMLWQVPPPASRVILPSLDAAYPHLFGPVIGSSSVYVGSLNGPIVAIRATDGALLWQTFVVPPTPVTDDTTQSPPTPPTQVHPLAAVHDALYVATDDSVVRLHSSDGVIENRLYPPSWASSGEVDPIVIGGSAYLGVTQVNGADSTYTLLDANGQRLWQVPITSSPGHVVAQDHGILFLLSGNFTAIRVTDGAVQWSTHFFVSRANIVAAGQLYVSASGERDRCHRSKNQSSPGLGASNETSGKPVWNRNLDVLG